MSADALRELVARWQAEADAREQTLGWYDPACAMQDKCADELEAALSQPAPEPDPTARLTVERLRDARIAYENTYAQYRVPPTPKGYSPDGWALRCRDEAGLAAMGAVLRAALTREGQ